MADLGWPIRGKPSFTMEAFQKKYDHYIVALDVGTASEVITKSWYQCIDALHVEHGLITNSFGRGHTEDPSRDRQGRAGRINGGTDFKYWDPEDVTAVKSWDP